MAAPATHDSLVCDEQLDDKDAEEDEGGAADVELEHGQVQRSVLQKRSQGSRGGGKACQCQSTIDPFHRGAASS